MKKGRSLVVLFSLLLLVTLAAMPLAAQQQSPAKAEASKDARKIPVPRVSEAMYARDMAMNGRAVQDPYLLIQAAELVITSRKIPRLKGQLAESGQEEKKKVDLDPANLLREAAKMAGTAGDGQAVQMAAEVARNSSIGLGNESLADEIAKTQVARGYAAGGAKSDSDCLAGGRAVTYTVPFRGGEDAQVSVLATNAIDSYVFSGDRLVTSDEDGSNVKYMSWHTITSGYLRIVVAANYGSTCYYMRIP